MKIKANLQKLAYIRGYELPTNLQNFTQKNLTKVKIFQNILGDLLVTPTCTPQVVGPDEYAVRLRSVDAFTA